MTRVRPNIPACFSMTVCDDADDSADLSDSTFSVTDYETTTTTRQQRRHRVQDKASVSLEQT